MFVLGVTGGSGSGKSILGAYLKEKYNALFLDADSIYHEMLRTDEKLIRALCEAFGEDILSRGQIDRAALGKKVFADPEKLSRLDRITHPLVIEKCRALIADAEAPFGVLDAFGLVQSGMNSLCDKCVAVVADREIRLARILQRDGIGRAGAAARLDAQPTDDWYRQACDDCIENNGTPEELCGKADMLISKYMGKDTTNMENNLREKLFYKKENGFDALSPEEMVELNAYCEDYKKFLDAGKTEREVCREAVKMAEKAGFVPYKGEKLKAGDKVYVVNNDRYVMLLVGGKKSVGEGIRFTAAHIDSPRLDLKPVPVYEDTDLCLLKTHYYGGIRKYQWVARPLAIHGVVTLKDGQVLDIVIGEKEDEPVFTVTDLLPHLGQDQSKKTLGEAFTGEQMNVLAGALPYADEDADRVKLTFLSLLHSTYGITEKDLITAEISLVPAGKAKDVGLDRSMVGAYGQDDRVCGYGALRAVLDRKETPEHTLVCALVDKEETGSDGVTGMMSAFFDHVMHRVCKAEGVDTEDCYDASLCLSADVTAAYDPTYGEAFEKRNASILNAGVGICKYTGARGKSGTSDATSELFGKVVSILEKKNVIWQASEMGRVDLGGGGTVAKYVANRNIPTIDVGTPVLSMHAPFEICGKLDVYMTYKAFAAFDGE